MPASSKWIDGLAPDSTVEAAARRSLEPRLVSVVQLLPMAAHLASHDIEHVHRLRVATRRATAALKLYRDCLQPRPARWMKRRLRSIRRAAGDARDLDVLAERLARDYGEPVAPIVELVARDREAVQPAILEVAHQAREDDLFIRKLSKLMKNVAVQEDESDAAGTLLVPEFGEWAVERFRQVIDEFNTAKPNESAVPAALHQFRIRAKALRYAIELVAPAFGSRQAELRGQLYPLIEELQERLGKVQDHVAAIERCGAWQIQSRNLAMREKLAELADAEARGLANAIRDFWQWWTAERQTEVDALLKP